MSEVKDLFILNIINSEVTRRNCSGEPVMNQILMNQNYIMFMQLPEEQRNRINEWVNTKVKHNPVTLLWEIT